MSEGEPTSVSLGARRVASHPLTRTQRLIWASQRRYTDAPLANMGDRIRILGRLDPDRFVAAVDAVVRRTELLRMVVDDDATATILQSPPATTEVIDLPVRELDDWSAARISVPIDARRAVYDSVLLRHDDDDWTWWIDVHHVAIDAWGAARLADAVAAAYAHDGPPDQADLSNLTDHEFFDDAEGDDRRDERAAEWKADRESAGPQAPLALYGARGPRTTAVDRVPVPLDDWREELDVALTSDYRSITRELSILTVAAMGAAISVHRLDGRSTVVVGVPVHHRSGRHGKRAIGPVMELYPLTLTVREGESHREMFSRTLRSIMQLLRRARPGESPDTPFEIVLNVITARYQDFAGMPATREWMRSGHVDANHPLRVQVFDQFDSDGEAASSRMAWELDLNEGLSADGSHLRFPRHFANALRAIVAEPDGLVGRAPLVTAAERAELADLNPDAAERPDDRPVHERIRDLLRADPDHIVAEHEGREWRAGEFDQAADAFARRLVADGLEPGRAVGLRMGRSVDVLVAMHGVLRAGGRFVFLDPADPSARHATIHTDADLFTIVDALPAPAGDLPTVELPLVTPDDGAYILYTSGSTGEPKGVPISHRGLTDYLRFAVESYCDEANPPWVALHSSLVFDLTITSLFLSFLTGGRTIVFEAEPVEALARIARDDRVTFLKATPSQLEILTRLAHQPLSLRRVVVGGEAFRRPVAERLRAACRHPVRIWNEYGPTEAVVGCMIHEYDPEADTGADVPIGHASPGAQLAVIDPLGGLTVPGAWGELWVRRPGMATGYLNRPELTAARFGPLDLPRDDRAVLGDGDDGTGTWYRTGDRVRIERPGVLVFGGRHDDQLKVNGIRLEPAEVEAALVGHPKIDTALVRVWHPADAASRRIDLRRCVRCGLGTDVPDLEIDDEGVCSTCHAFDAVEPQTREWFRTDADLAARLADARERRRGDYDCLHLLSGGKDSTYALYQLVERGWKVHALTLDNGFISDGAKANIRSSIADLGITHEFVTTSAMKEILADSLDRHSNVCQGCYKTIYTLAVARADEMGIPVIVTGLSRGQFFETRLVPHQFEKGRFDADRIDETVLEARRVYHHTDDAVTALLPEQRVFDDDEIFDRVEFVDFYRYVDVELAEMYDFLEHRAPWVRPADTGRSTNCLINVAGIRVHLGERGFHNYAEPYSWDVRLGHKTREEALEELDDEIDEDEVARLLAEIGYEPKSQGVLTAWYQTADGTDIDPDELRVALRESLPDHAVPAAFVRVDEVPLAASAKADPSLLPAPTRFHRRGRAQVAATTETERILVGICSEILALEPIGVTDDFFDLGGASLDALEVVSHIDQRFGTDLPDATVFRARTIRELAELVDAAETTESSVAAYADAGDHDGPLPLSPGEEAMLFEYRLDPDDTRYNVTRIYTLDGPVDPKALESALRDVVMHHAPLHTQFDAARTTRSRDDAVEWIEFEPMSPADFDAFADRQRRVPFDLDRGPLVRVHTAEIGETRRAVLIAMHHIVVDAGTFDTLWAQVSRRVAGHDLPRLPLSYAAHAAGQRLRHERDDASRRFWIDRAATRDGHATISMAVPVPEPDGYVEHRPGISVADLKAVRHTPFAAALAATGAVVSTFAGHDRVELGVTVSTNDRADTADVVGYYLNTMALGLAVDHEAPFSELVDAASEEIAATLPHRTYPFASVVRDARAAGLAVPDVSVMLAYERLEAPVYPGAVARQRILASGTSVSDITFFVQERDDDIRLGLEYRGSVITGADAERLLEAFALVLEQGVRDETRTVDSLTASLRDADLQGAPRSRDDVPVLERFLEHVERTPRAVAVADTTGTTLDYADLAGRVANLADRLASGTTPPPARIGVCIARSADLVVGLLAVQFARAGYVALDPTLPRARLELIAGAAGLDMIVTDDPTRAEGLAPLIVDLATDSGSGDLGDALPRLRTRLTRLDDNDEAYVIFTSGSTGRPRGVGVTHRNLAASTGARDDWFDQPPTRFLVTSSPGFDSSIVGLFWPLATGGTVVVPADDEVRDIDRLADAIADTEATHTLMVPSLMRALLDRAPEKLTHLEVSIVAGEACPPALARRHHELLPGVALVNEYGPTEATVWSTAHRVTADDDPVPIGRPVPGVRVRVADSSLRPVPVGAAGELLVSGPGVTDGYLDDVDATRARFVEVDDRRWYRTGDLVRRVGDDLHFLGRVDDQLNIGGVRLEPAEIERELDALPGVIESVVVAAGDPPSLVAHLESETASIDEAALRRALSERLPTTAVPRRFSAQPALPRTANGKIDRAAAAILPLPTQVLPPASATDDNSLAETVLGAWRRVLAPTPVDADTDFFAAGGDSLTAVELVTEVGDRLGRRVPIADLLAGPTPAAMVSLLSDGHAPSRGVAPSDDVVRPVRLRPGRPDGPLVIMVPSWDDLFGYQALAEAFVDEVEVVALAYEPRPGQREVNRVPDLVEEMLPLVAPLRPEARPVAVLGWSIGGVSAVELAGRLRETGTRVDRVALVDTFFPGEERHLWSNRWWKYKSMARLEAVPELRKELGSFVRRRIAGPVGRRLLRWSGSDPQPAGTTGTTRMLGSFPAEAFGHRPTPPGVPVVFYRASTTNPERTIRRWEELATEITDVVIEGRHRGFDSIMHADKVGRIADDLVERLGGASGGSS